jgi:hypothetical protein
MSPGGQAYNDKGDHDRAVHDFDQAIKLNSYIYDALYNRAYTFENELPRRKLRGINPAEIKPLGPSLESNE